MPGINLTITRGHAAPTMRRDAVKQGLVFAVKQRGDRLGQNYASVGANGRMYSVNVNSKELASSGNPSKSITITGSWTFKVDRTHRRGVTGRKCRRSEVRAGEIFMVEGGRKEYIHLGRITKDKTGFLSIPLANQENHAVTRNGDSNVEVVATAAMEVRLAR